MFKKFIDKIRDAGGGETPGANIPIPGERVEGAADLRTPLTISNRPDSNSRASSTGIPGLKRREGDAAPPPEKGITQNEVEDNVYRLRAEQVQRVESLFAEFGGTVCSYVLTQTLMPGGLKRLLAKLDLSPRGREGADLALISSWIAKNGIPEFCTRVSIRIPKDLTPLVPRVVTPPPDAPPAAHGPDEFPTPLPRRTGNE